MSSLKQQLIGFIGLTGLYIGIIALFLPGQLTPQNALSIGFVLVMFVLSTLITSTGKVKDAETNAQKFLLGTTVQMLLALFYILLARFLSPDHFKAMSIHFLVLFFAFLAMQTFFLVRRVRRT